MRIPDEIIEEVRRRNDIVDIVSGHVDLKYHVNSYRGLCPFHEEITPSFMVHPEKQLYKCFGCGKAGDVIIFMMEIRKKGYRDAVVYLADVAGVEIPETCDGK